MLIFKRYAWLIGGFAAIVVGYLLLGSGDISLAPLLLVLGYCLLIPIFLLQSFLQGKGE
ncbi:hypothetical protein KKG45_05980 [bacterium]|nr:hypothetical protein [bacterium]MBU1072776.1 hypothetical protein [bacterium]MBU1676272.1 hypothetical protein [bacterium]